MTGVVILEAVLIALSLLFITATVLPFIRSDKWWIRMFDFPRMQFAFGGVLTIALYLPVWDAQSVTPSVILALLVLCVSYQGYKMYPYTFLASKQVLSSDRHTDDSSLSLLISNVLRDNRNGGRYLEIVNESDPDILLAVETNTWWIEQALST
jgi:endonuclease/exonuclease/phosphatase (EEP) superfamily protein YafD